MRRAVLLVMGHAWTGDEVKEVINCDLSPLLAFPASTPFSC